jgi:hypothetical protein
VLESGIRVSRLRQGFGEGLAREDRPTYVGLFCR